MEPIEIPQYRILQGEKAIEALLAFIDELESQKNEKLKDKQTTALIKFGKGLISSIETETRVNTSSDETGLVRNLKKAITKRFSDARARVSSVFIRESSI